jgi:hypothetical protein
MKKRTRILVVTGTGLLLLLSGSLCAYFLRNAQDAGPSYERGTPALPLHVLVAAQGSAFKDRLVTTLVGELERRPAYVKVIDVGALPGVDAASWQAIVIVHSWEFGKPPRVVSDFTVRLPDTGKVIDVTTSGGGREKLAGVDAISSASIMDEVPALVAQVSAKLDVRLSKP